MFTKLSPWLARSANFLPAILSNCNTPYLFSQMNIRCNHSYRNRYTHFANAYPRSVPKGYYVIGLFCAGGFVLYTLRGELWLDAKLDERCGNTKKTFKSNKVECQSIPVSENLDQEKPKEKTGFRARKFIAYEDRIRAYSTPDKIFRYFATLKCVEEDGSTEVFMTPDDFLRAITPGTKQPDGLDLDAFKRFDPKRDKLELDISKDSVFYCLGENALISFTDFVFLLTVISTPQRQFEIAFRMFDLNGDGELDASEFDVVRSVILDTTAMGKRHRDHSNTGNTLKSVNHSALHDYFFGQKGDEKLTIAKFLSFQARLQEEITLLEFKHLQQHTKFERLTPLPDAQNEDRITEQAFARSLLTYAGFSENKRRLMLRRVNKKYSEKDTEATGITFKQFLDFSRLLRSISELDTALTFHTLAGAAIDQATFIHMAQVVSKVSLTPHMVDVVFTLFDENDDGQLSYKEFVQVMKNRLLRGLDKPMDTGFIRFVNALFYCVHQEIRKRFD